ncbi:MAG: BatA domain-containing protein, partial [Gemmatimonadetes bacterium]|nr:BatA domain-containing protein [Gemmatimonadota bacterium]
MSFLHPWMLLGLGAAAIPIILHLIARRRPPTVIFPAVRYLVDTAREHQRRLRIRNLLLLLVRTALIVALMLAASGPSVPISGVPGHAPSALVVIVDNSVSSGAVAGGTAVGEPLRRAAAEVLSRATAEDALWLLTADGLARSGDRKMLTRVVDSLATSSMRLDLGQAIRQADAILAGEERPGEIFLITDLQRTAVSPAATQAPLVVVRPEGDVVSNIGVGSVATGTQPWQFDGGRLIVTIAGDADGPVALSVAVGGRPERQALAGPGAPVAVTVTGLTPGWWPVVVSVDPDELRADDRRVTAVRVAPVARVTWNPDDLHLATAVQVLEADGRVRRGNEVTLGGLGRGLSVVFPPADPAEVGALNRALGRRGVAWRFGDPVNAAERSDSGALVGAVAVARRYRLERSTAGGTGVLATVGGDPWMVRDAGVVLLGSRLDPEWTELPLAA